MVISSRQLAISLDEVPISAELPECFRRELAHPFLQPLKLQPRNEVRQRAIQRAGVG